MVRKKKNEIADLAAELTNKVRWAIGTSIESFSGWTYSEQKAVASVFSQDIITLAKVKQDSPHSSWDSETVRSTLARLEVDKPNIRLVS